MAKFWDVLIPTGKSKKYINTLSEYMCREMKPLTELFQRGDTPQYLPKRELEKTPIWVCWWQGEAAMPPIVKACVNRIQAFLPETAELHLITIYNLCDYLDMPEHVIAKYQKGTISAAHLSDVLRFGLLSCYGGAWLDATVFLTKSFPSIMLTQNFYTQRFYDWGCCPHEACRGKWCGFYLGGKAGQPIFCYMYSALSEWWRNHDRIIDYVFFDYILWAGYCGVPAIRETIDSVEPGNENIWLLAKHLNDAYTPEKYAKFMESNDFFKLSYKGQLDIKTQNGQKTIYAYILEENNVS